MFVEFGYFRPEVDPNPAIQNEVVIQQLRNDFGSTLPFNQSRYALSDDYGARIGASWQITPHLKFSGAYRILSLDEDLDAWVGGPARPIVGDGPDCGCLNQERNVISADAFEFGVFYVF